MIVKLKKSNNQNKTVWDIVKLETLFASPNIFWRPSNLLFRGHFAWGMKPSLISVQCLD